MLDRKLLDDISAKVRQLIAESPAADLEKNLQALLQGVFAKLDLVTREEFDAQTQVLANARTQLDALEARLRALEEPSARQDS